MTIPVMGGDPSPDRNHGDRIAAPGETVGILGGGQLGRMMAIAAARLGYQVHIYCPESDPPAAQVANLVTTAPYDDRTALAEFAAGCAVITYEFENVPHAAASFLERQCPVRPSPSVLAIAQDRIAEKDFVTNLGIGTALYRAVDSVEQMADAITDIGRPAVLKATRFGYDGKGQAKIAETGELDYQAIWDQMGGERAILEGFVPFEREVSVVVARSLDGSVATFSVTENEHRNHILWTSTAPARISPILGARADDIARRIAHALDLVGLIAVEMFVCADGSVLVNELAPRPHNSGHWTIDACVTDQFEQSIRAVCGLPLGETERLSDAVMTNLLGHDIDAYPVFLSEPRTKLHLYGKSEAREGRKMGHVTRLFPRGS